MSVAAAQHPGTVVQIIGPVVDVEFDAGHLPAIYNALHITAEAGGGGEPIDIVCEVEQHIGENRVRAIAMKRDRRLAARHEGRRSRRRRFRCRWDRRRSAAS